MQYKHQYIPQKKMVSREKKRQEAGDIQQKLWQMQSRQMI